LNVRIEKLELAGYPDRLGSLGFCMERKILVQGRGSAANSGVCYSLAITSREVGHNHGDLPCPFE
jgi:error-prone DNA polymerase